ncbi:MAG: response regulator [Opitutaceae bacterium]|nr:response regulator [Opitutaceae bacterium]
MVVVGDDAGRPLVAAMLRSYRANSDAAAGSYAALTAFRATPERDDLVLLDMLIPGLSGEETLVELRRVRADVRALIIKGYNEGEGITRHAGGGPLADTNVP